MYKQITSAVLFAAGVSAHGRLNTPTPRPLGDAMKAACGEQVWNQMSSDPNGNIQTMAQVGASQSDFDATECHLWQCRGYQFDDATTDTIQSFTAGQTVEMKATIAAPHTGVANVSIIDLSSNSVISELASWSDYASTATGVTANETSWSVTIPSDLPSTCATAGGCAIQWWWDARSIDQTYMSCVDFAVAGASGSSSSSGSSSGSSASSSAVPASSAAPATTAAPSSTLATSVVATSTAPATTSSAAAAANAATGSSSGSSSSSSGSDSSSDDSSSSSCTKKRAARRAAMNARAARMA